MSGKRWRAKGHTAHFLRIRTYTMDFVFREINDISRAQRTQKKASLKNLLSSSRSVFRQLCSSLRVIIIISHSYLKCVFCVFGIRIIVYLHLIVSASAKAVCARCIVREWNDFDCIRSFYVKYMQTRHPHTHTCAHTQTGIRRIENIPFETSRSTKQTAVDILRAIFAPRTSTHNHLVNAHKSE